LVHQFIHQRDDVEKLLADHLIGIFDVEVSLSAIAGPSRFVSFVTIDPHLVVVPSLLTDQHMFFLSRQVRATPV